MQSLKKDLNTKVRTVKRNFLSINIKFNDPLVDIIKNNEFSATFYQQL